MPVRQKRPATSAVLLYADTERSADMLYFGRFRVPDPFIAMGVRRRKIAVLNALEFGRALKESEFDEVLPLEAWQQRAKKRLRVERAGPAEVVAVLARELGVRAFAVPADFPVGPAMRLQALGLRIQPVDALRIDG